VLVALSDSGKALRKRAMHVPDTVSNGIPEGIEMLGGKFAPSSTHLRGILLKRRSPHAPCKTDAAVSR